MTLFLIAACPMFGQKQLLLVLLYVAAMVHHKRAAMFVCWRINTEDDCIGTRPAAWQ